jgi:arabinan endo-1,5-alpha-L-arabinosidase
VAQSPTLNSQLTGDLVPTHDPVITREGDTYYVFGTGVPGEAGRYLLSRTSKDLVHWTAGKPLFDHIPDWAQKAVPGTKEMWAPDISYVNGRWRLYYAVSTFGGNRSAIGLFTSPTLDPAKPGYGWRDEGLVLMSQRRMIITPSIPMRRWMRRAPLAQLRQLLDRDQAGRTRWQNRQAASPRGQADLHRAPPGARGCARAHRGALYPAHGGAYWLFASYDYCCKGVNSTYYTVVSRADKITGPYLGKDGSAMMQGGGTIFLRADLPEQERSAAPAMPVSCMTRMAPTSWPITPMTRRTTVPPRCGWRASGGVRMAGRWRSAEPCSGVR